MKSVPFLMTVKEPSQIDLVLRGGGTAQVVTAYYQALNIFRPRDGPRARLTARRAVKCGDPHWKTYGEST